MAELADARDLKSRDAKASYRFDPGYRHQQAVPVPDWGRVAACFFKKRRSSVHKPSPGAHTITVKPSPSRKKAKKRQKKKEKSKKGVDKRENIWYNIIRK